MNLTYRKNDGSIKYNLSNSDSTYINLDRSYYLLDDSQLVGLFSLTNLYSNDLELKYVILEEHRRKGYASALTSYLLDKIFESNTEREKIKLFIDFNNPIALKVAENNSFEIDYSMYEKMQELGEKNNMIPYYKRNPYYIKNSYSVKEKK